MKKKLNDEALTDRASKINYFFTDIDGTLTNGCTYYSENGETLKQFHHRDGTAVALLNFFNLETVFITGENSIIVQQRANKLNIKHCFLNVKNKSELLKKFANEHEIPLTAIAYMGDDINDLKAMQCSGLSFAPGNASEVILNNVHVQCKSRGGEGAFREAVEKLLELKGCLIQDFIGTL